MDNTYASNFNNSRKTKNHSARAGQHKVNGDKVNGDKVNVDKHNEDKHNEVINNHNLIIDKFNESNGTLGIMSSNKNLQFIKEPIDIETYLTEAEYGPVLITEGHWVYESKDYYFILKDTSLGGGYLIDTQGCEFVGVLKNEYNKIFREDKNYNEVGWEKLLEEVEAKSSQYICGHLLFPNQLQFYETYLPVFDSYCPDNEENIEKFKANFPQILKEIKSNPRK